jgi:hypothetical protein
MSPDRGDWNAARLDDLATRQKEDIAALRSELRALGDKIDVLTGSQKFTSAQRTTMITTGIAAIGTVVATVLTGGPT